MKIKRSTVLFLFMSFISLSALIAAPFGVNAQGLGVVTDASTLGSAFNDLFTIIIDLLAGLALVYFLWGATQFIMNGGDEKKREEGRQQMIWGIVGLFIMISVWGLVNILVHTFNVVNDKPKLPKL